MLVQFLVHTETKREYQILALDKAAGTITLKGAHTEFTEPFDKDRFKANGYTLVNREVADTPTEEFAVEQEAEDGGEEDDDDHED